MPTLPTYGAPREQESQLRVPSAPPAAFGVPANVDLSGVGNVVQQHVQQAQDHADAMVVDAAELAHSQLQTDMMTKATSAQGVDALAAAHEAQTTYQQQSQQIIDGLPNDRVKQLVARRAQGYFAHLYEATESHAASETKKADAAHVTALLNNDLETARALPSMAPGLADQTRARTEDFGRRNGWDDAQIQQESAQRVSSIHFAALGKLLQDGDPRDVSMATSYLDNYKEALVGKQRVQAESMVDEATAQSDGYKESDKILGLNQPADAVVDPTDAAVQQGVTPSGKSPTTMLQALDLASKIPDARARKAAVQEIRSHFADIETAQRYDREAARTEVLQYVESHGGKIPYSSAAWQKIAGHPEGEHVEHRSEQLLKPAKDPGDPEKFMVSLAGASANPASRQDFLTMNFMGKDGEGMNTSQKTYLAKLQQQYGAQAIRASTPNPAQAEQLRFERESALQRAAKIADPAERDAEVSRLNAHFDALQAAHGIPVAAVQHLMPSGDNPLGRFHRDVEPDHPVVPIQATTQMIQEAALSPAYAQHLRNIGVGLPAKLPVPRLEPPKK